MRNTAGSAHDKRDVLNTLEDVICNFIHIYGSWTSWRLIIASRCNNSKKRIRIGPLAISAVKVTHFLEVNSYSYSYIPKKGTSYW